MIDVEDIQLDGREVGILHLWEMQEGALAQPIIKSMAEANKDLGCLIAYHRILTQSTYKTQISMRRRFFTQEEADLLSTQPLSNFSPPRSLEG